MYKLDNIVWAKIEIDVYRATAAPAKATSAAAKETRFFEAAPVNLAPPGVVADGDTVGTIGEPVALAAEPPTPVPVLPEAVTGAVPVANPVEPPYTPVELEVELARRDGRSVKHVT